MICYRCGAEIGKNDYCPECSADVSIFQKVVRISNQYYNDGLEQAQVKNMSGAIVSLKKSLKFYKYNTDARNLLGLVYYEIGETVEALGEWVISANYQGEDNAAVRYLREIHNNRGQLETINQTIKKYNQAILYCKQGSRDLAIIQLKKVLALNPKLVKGHQLLALLYLQEGQYEKAKKSLRNAGKIDADNTLTLKYLKEVNRKLKEKGGNKKTQNDDLISYQSGNETIIMPKRFRETSLMGTIGYIVIGLVVGIAVTGFLIVPGVKNKAANEAKKKLIEASDTISTNGQTITDLEKKITTLQDKLDEALSDKESVQTKIKSYEDLLDAYEIYASGDVEKTGEALDKIDTSYLSKEAKATYDSLKEEIYDKYMKSLYTKGYRYYGSGNWEKAIETLLKVVENDMSYEDGSAVYYLAQSYRRNNDLDSAKEYYQYVIDNYPGTQKAKTAENYINAVE